MLVTWKICIFFSPPWPLKPVLTACLLRKNTKTKVLSYRGSANGNRSLLCLLFEPSQLKSAVDRSLEAASGIPKCGNWEYGKRNTLQGAWQQEIFLVGRAFIAVLAMPFAILTTAFCRRAAHKTPLTARAVGQRKQPASPAWDEHPSEPGCQPRSWTQVYLWPYFRQKSLSSQRLSLKTDWIKSRWGSFHDLAPAVSHHSSAAQILEADVCKLITWPLNSSKPPKVLHYVSTGLRNRYVLLANWITYGVD